MQKPNVQREEPLPAKAPPPGHSVQAMVLSIRETESGTAAQYPKITVAAGKFGCGKTLVGLTTGCRMERVREELKKPEPQIQCTECGNLIKPYEVRRRQLGVIQIVEARSKHGLGPMRIKCAR